MKWFNKKPTVEATLTPKIDDRIEAEVSHNATKEAFRKADEANQRLNSLLVENGFTLKIYLAAGGNYKRKGKQT